jgi:hypothetical protein
MAPFFFRNEWCFSIASAKVQLFSETTKFFYDFLSENCNFFLKTLRKRYFFRCFCRNSVILPSFAVFGAFSFFYLLFMSAQAAFPESMGKRNLERI